MDATRSTGRRDSLLYERKMWVDFRILENPSSMRTVFLWSRHLLFVVILYRGKPSKNKNPIDSSMEKAVCENYISGSGDQITYEECTAYEVAPL